MVVFKSFFFLTLSCFIKKVNMFNVSATCCSVFWSFMFKYLQQPLQLIITKDCVCVCARVYACVRECVRACDCVCVRVREREIEGDSVMSTQQERRIH